jgi:short subunit dehydrogenase-like uncharacterized protein
MRYKEFMGSGSWLAAVATGLLVSTLGFLLFVASRVQFIRNRLPLAGTGPSRKDMESGYFKLKVHALSDTSDGSKPVRVVASVEDKARDGGYLSTSRMILECALSMALQMEDIKQDPYASKHAGGVLTPASAAGNVLLGRLKNAGTCFCWPSVSLACARLGAHRCTCGPRERC